MRNVQTVINNSFTRVIITATSVLSVVSLLIRNWTYVYWVDFLSSRQVIIKYY